MLSQNGCEHVLLELHVYIYDCNKAAKNPVVLITPDFDTPRKHLQYVTGEDIAWCPSQEDGGTNFLGDGGTY